MAQRNTTIRNKHRTRIARTRPPCALCGNPIDYTLRWPDPDCYVIDHIIPLAAGGSDSIGNKQPAHSACNLAKSDHDPAAQRVRETTRQTI